MRTDGHRHLSRIGARVTVPGLPGAWTGARGQHGCASVQGIDCAARQSSWRGRSNRSSSRACESPLQLNFRSPLCWGTPAVDKERGTGPRERTFPDVPPVVWEICTSRDCPSKPAEWAFSPLTLAATETRRNETSRGAWRTGLSETPTGRTEGRCAMSSGGGMSPSQLARHQATASCHRNPRWQPPSPIWLGKRGTTTHKTAHLLP